MFGLMNPSGAGVEVGDSTVIRTGAFSRRWGFGGQIIVNACGYRQTDNAKLLDVADPVGPRNTEWALRMADQAALIVIGHGQMHRSLQPHADALVAALRAAGHKLHVFRLSKKGVPVHPLARGKHRVPDEATPVVWPAGCG